MDNYRVTLEELQQFHIIDRQVYSRLVIDSGFDSNTAKVIVAFWNFLEEKKGYDNFVNKARQLSDVLLLQLANEAIKCLNCLLLSSSSQHVVDIKINDLPVMRSLVVDARKEISLGFLYVNTENAVAKIEKFIKDVCDRAFIDIDIDLLKINSSNGSQSSQFLQPQVNKTQDLGNNNNNGGGGDDVPVNDRTLFVTFSKGYPLTKQQLEEFFNRKFGEDCVEAVWLNNYHQPALYARVIVKSFSMVESILGDKELLQFCINGKDIRVRRFVPKHDKQRPSTAAVAAPSAVNVCYNVPALAQAAQASLRIN